MIRALFWDNDGVLVDTERLYYLATRDALATVGIPLTRERYGAMLAREPLVIDGVRETLEALHGSYAMAVVTSSRRDHFLTIHARTGLLEYFRFVLTEQDYPRTKPHPDPYLLAIERSGFPREECLVIEDSARGLIAARAAGGCR